MSDSGVGPPDRSVPLPCVGPGVSLEDVSRLRTHKSLQSRERHYAHWFKERRDQLDVKCIEAMRKSETRSRNR